MKQHHHTALSTLALFSSMSTLVCCALPALFVALGAGATLAGIVSDVPQLVWFSEHKKILFIVSAILLSFASFLRFKTRNAPCPADPAMAKACTRTRKFGGIVLYSSIAIYLTGLFFAYIAPAFMG